MLQLIATTTRSPLQHPRNPPQLAELTVLRTRFCFNNRKVEDLRPKIELGSGVLSSQAGESWESLRPFDGRAVVFLVEFPGIVL